MRIQRSRGARRLAWRPAWAQAAARISDARLRRRVEALAIPRSPDREAAANRRVARDIAAALSACGLEPRFQGRYANVVAATPAAAARPCVLVGAHYDSVAGCPGADDNASAVAAMLECAEVLAPRGDELPLCFVAFNSEEHGRRGSADFVARLPASPLRVRIAHVLEMVGYRDPRPGSQSRPPELPVRIPRTGDFLAVLANWRSRRAAGRVLRLARGRPELPVLSLKVYRRVKRMPPVLLRSDHASFWERGIPSLLWTDTAEFRNPHYHLASDTPETLDYTFLHRVTQLLSVAVLSEAGG